jgi:hypothetical protein
MGTAEFPALRRVVAAGGRVSPYYLVISYIVAARYTPERRRAVRLSVLPVVGLLVASATQTVPSQVPVGGALPPYVLSGTVVDDKDVPIPNAELTLRRAGIIVAVVRSLSSGAFDFETDAGGMVEITARRIGFSAQTSTVDLDHRSPKSVIRIVLSTLATEVSPLVVTGSGRLAQFYQNRKEYAFGHFMDRAEIEKSRARFASDLFRGVAGASLRVSRRYGNVIRLRGCQPTVWIDRLPMRDVELDEVAVPEEIAGLEIYTSSSGVPPQFMDRSGRSCGAIVVWTRSN